MMLRKAFLPAIALAAVLAATAATAATPEFHAAHDGVGYIRSLQEADGGFPAFGSGSAPGSTIDAVFAIASTGRDATGVTSGGNGPDDYLATQAASYASDPGAAAKLALGVSILGLDPSSFGGEDLIATMDAAYNDATGEYGLDLFDHALFILALVAAGEAVPAATTAELTSLQQGDGGWEFGTGFGSDTNTTAIVLQALIASGTAAASGTVQDGLAFLAAAQNADGGFGFDPASDSDPNTTGLIIQALVAAGEDIDEGGPWAPNGNTPVEGLLAFRNASTGAFQFFGEDSAFATYQAVPALMLAPLPDLPVAKQAEPSDMDEDGCTDARENGGDEEQGGRRNYLHPWDFYDIDGDGEIDLFNDVFGVANDFGLTPLDFEYTEVADRSAPPGAEEEPDPARREPWDMGPPDGLIDLFNDVFGVAVQFGHGCL